MDKQTLLKGFTDRDEKYVFAKLLDTLDACLKYHEPGFSDFLDPKKTEKFISIIKTSEIAADLNILAYGGFEDAERKMIGVTPYYSDVSEKDFPIEAIMITHNAKFGKGLSHRDFLGSVLGLGVERELVGDILPGGSGAFVLLNQSIAGFVRLNLSQVARVPVKIRAAAPDELYAIIPLEPPANIAVASLRLDAVLSAVFGISRSKTTALILAKKAFINWNPAINADKQVSKDDTITLRGVGRVKIVDVIGNTRKGRIVLEIIKKG